tara:strand:+ start:13512 stop:14225 length:714 start_codon:yes stop_codon:yes gene_type:complete
MKFNKLIDFVAVNYNSLDYAEILTKSITKFVDTPHNIIIVDNSDQLSELHEINSNLLLLKGNNNVDQGNAPSLASAAHASSIEKGIQSGTAEYICICDIDICFLSAWTHEILPMLNDNVFISHRWEPSFEIARPQFMIFKRSWYKENNFKFNANYKDTGGFLTKFCTDNELKFGIITNSYNIPELKDAHIFKEITNGEQAFSENKIPWLFHHGRGTLGNGHPNRKQWYSVLRKYLLI